MLKSPLKKEGKWEILEFPAHTTSEREAAGKRSPTRGEKEFVVGGDLAQQLQRQTVAAVQQVAGWTRPRVRNVWGKMEYHATVLRGRTLPALLYMKTQHAITDQPLPEARLNCTVLAARVCRLC